METNAEINRFSLPVSWDVALRVLKDSARHGRTPLEIHRHGNGYLQLRQSRYLRRSVVIDVVLLAAGESTTVVVTDVTRRLWTSAREHRRARDLIEQLRADAVRFAIQQGDIDETNGPERAHPSAQSVDDVARLREAAMH